MPIYPHDERTYQIIGAAMERVGLLLNFGAKSLQYQRFVLDQATGHRLNTD